MVAAIDQTIEGKKITAIEGLKCLFYIIFSKFL
jgi:hypothetical protein